ncbi:hypothetical protein MMPV_005156 [Pyropia vietnamensis]
MAVAAAAFDPHHGGDGGDGGDGDSRMRGVFAAPRVTKVTGEARPPPPPTTPHVTYIAPTTAYLAAAAGHPRHPTRAATVAALHTASGVDTHPAVRVTMVPAAPDAALRAHHAAAYVVALTAERPAAEWGLEGECPAWVGLSAYARTRPAPPVWRFGGGGGRHHARWDGAAGFCYVNDVVLGASALAAAVGRVAVVDLDAHFGDAVDAAFAVDPSVLTASFHRAGPGVYPPVRRRLVGGGIRGNPQSAAAATSVRIPLAAGTGNAEWAAIVIAVAAVLRRRYAPAALLLVAGADALAGDPLGGGLRVGIPTYTRVVAELLSWELPTVVVGGGGYVDTAAARLWTALAATAAGVRLPDDVPNHDGWAAYREGGWRMGVPVGVDGGGGWAPDWASGGVPGGASAVAAEVDVAMAAAGWGAWR